MNTKIQLHCPTCRCTSAPSLYPVTVTFNCADHGEIWRGTVTSLKAQTQWESYVAERHKSHRCYRRLHTLVPVD